MIRDRITPSSVPRETFPQISIQSDITFTILTPSLRELKKLRIHEKRIGQYPRHGAFVGVYSGRFGRRTCCIRRKGSEYNYHSEKNQWLCTTHEAERRVHGLPV